MTDSSRYDEASFKDALALTTMAVAGDDPTALALLTHDLAADPLTAESTLGALVQVARMAVFILAKLERSPDHPELVSFDDARPDALKVVQAIALSITTELDG